MELYKLQRHDYDHAKRIEPVARLVNVHPIHSVCVGHNLRRFSIMKDKSPIRKGNVLRPSAAESWVLKGMSSKRDLHRAEVKFFASDAAECPRRAVKFLHTHRKEAITPASTAYMKLGIIIHELVSDALHKTNRLIFKEFRLPKRVKPDIRGIVDAIFFGPDDKILGMEIKSCGNLPGRPRDGHELQALTYSALTGLDFVILYVSRKVAGWDGKLMIKSFDIECDEITMMHTLTQVCLAYFANAKKVLPEIPPTFKQDANCRFCPFQTECWEGEEEDLPTVGAGMLDELYSRAEERAEAILGEREAARTGILKHCQRHASPLMQRKLRSAGWS